MNLMDVEEIVALRKELPAAALVTDAINRAREAKHTANRFRKMLENAEHREREWTDYARNEIYRDWTPQEIREAEERMLLDQV